MSNTTTYVLTDDDYYLTPCAIVTCTFDEARALLARLGPRWVLVETTTLHHSAGIAEAMAAGRGTSPVKFLDER